MLKDDIHDVFPAFNQPGGMRPLQQNKNNSRFSSRYIRSDSTCTNFSFAKCLHAAPSQWESNSSQLIAMCRSCSIRSVGEIRCAASLRSHSSKRFGGNVPSTSFLVGGGGWTKLFLKKYDCSQIGSFPQFFRDENLKNRIWNQPPSFSSSL